MNQHNGLPPSPGVQVINMLKGPETRFQLKISCVSVIYQELCLERVGNVARGNIRGTARVIVETGISYQAKPPSLEVSFRGDDGQGHAWFRITEHGRFTGRWQERADYVVAQPARPRHISAVQLRRKLDECRDAIFTDVLLVTVSMRDEHPCVVVKMVRFNKSLVLIGCFGTASDSGSQRTHTG